jgi:dienelactone hydrolase
VKPILIGPRVKEGLYVLACLAAIAFATAAPAGETVLSVPVKTGNDSVSIEVTLYEPDGDGPFPVAVLSHGSPRSAADRRSMGRVRYEAQSREFLARGFAVAVPTRRGYGNSGGEWAEGYGSCNDPDYARAGLESARDIRATLEALKSNPHLDTKRVLLVGVSAGGWASVAASSTDLPGLKAVINFAGGRGSQGPDSVCYASRLVDAAALYGKTSTVPQLWVYAANDKFFGPDLAQRLVKAFTAAGGHATLKAMPAFGADGHSLFGRGTPEWTPVVREFLAENGLPGKR